MKKQFFKSDGFTLIEVMVAAGLVGILALALSQQSQLVGKSKKQNNEMAVINNLTDRLAVELAREQTCRTNFGGKTINNPSPAPTYVTDSTGAKIIETTKYYGRKDPTAGAISAGSGDFIQVSGITTKINPENNREMILVVSFKKKTFLNSLPNIEIPLNIIPDPLDSTKVKTCYNDITNSIAAAVRLSCNGNAMKYYTPEQDPPYGSCYTDQVQNLCPNAGEFLSKIEVDPVTKKLKGTCSKFTVGTCSSANQVITSFNSDGSVNCGDPLPFCPMGQFLVKASGAGYTCINLGNICPVRQAIQKFNSNATVSCAQYYPPKTCATFVQSISPSGVVCQGGYIQPVTCPTGKFIVSFDGTGKAVCDWWTQTPQSCPGGYGLTGFDANGIRTCQPLLQRLSCVGGYSPGGRTYTDCRNAGGAVQNPGTTNAYCLFNSSGCPGGYSLCNNYGNSWGTVSCTDTNSGCSYSVSTRYATGTGVFQSPYWGAQRTATCYYWARNSGPWNRSCTLYGGGPTATTPVTQVGCY